MINQTVKLLLVLMVLGLVLSQSTTTSVQPATGIVPLKCTKPCYGINVSPVNASAYYCSKYEYCNYHPELGGCYNCDNYCKVVNCFAEPCSVNNAAKQCAQSISSDAVCVNSYCGGCNAEWFLNGVRICQLAGQVKCPVCTLLCIKGYEWAFNETTGCRVCKCVPICPLIPICLNKCPYGYEVDENGCRTCNCKTCPPVCDIFCEYGHKVDPVTGCTLCACNPPPSTCRELLCPRTFNASKCLPYGQQYDQNGCPLCECRTKACPIFNCPIIRGPCLYGYVRDADGCATCACKPPPCQPIYCPLLRCAFGFAKDSNGCTICKCNPAPCIKYCPFGQILNQTSCSCHCPPIKCLFVCPHGYETDIYGCPSCVCKKNLQICPKIECDLYCADGYADDSNGCPTCKCKTPLACPRIQDCSIFCINGYHVEVDACGQCRCVPCPPFKCLFVCPYGHAVDTNGCPACRCNPKPVCPSLTCNLKCLNGYVLVNGCPTCKCAPSPPCVCGPKPLFEILCPDKKHYAGYTNICTRINGTCGWVYQQCPIVINITVPEIITLADIQLILIVLDIPIDASVEILLLSDSKGYKTYEIVIPYELKPTTLTDSQLITDLEAALVQLFESIHVTIKVVQSSDAIIENKALSMAASTSASTNQTPQMNGDGRIIIFMGILAILALFML